MHVHLLIWNMLVVSGTFLFIHWNPDLTTLELTSGLAMVGRYSPPVLSSTNISTKLNNLLCLYSSINALSFLVSHLELASFGSHTGISIEVKLYYTSYKFCNFTVTRHHYIIMLNLVMQGKKKTCFF